MIIRHFQFKSFATRMSMYVLSFTLVIFIAMMGLFYTYLRNKITEHAIERTHERLHNIANQINSLLFTVETTMNQSIWMIEEYSATPDSLRRIITSVVENNDLIVGSGIAFRPGYYKEKGKYFMPYASLQDGKISFQTLGAKDYDYPCMDWYLIPTLLKQNYWSEPYYDKGGGNFIMCTYSIPLYDKKGDIYAVFTANISLSEFTEMVTHLKPYPSSFTFLLSRNGSYLTHPDLPKIMNETIFTNAFESNNEEEELTGREMLAGKTGTREIDYEGKPAFVFYTSIPNIGWSVGNICPANVILSELDSTSKQIIYSSLAVILILFLIINVIIRKVVRPLAEFAQSARAIATGRFDVKLPDVHSKDEIKNLHDSLAYMQQSLSAYINELKQTTAAKERIESELSIAREIQMGMIPKIFPPFPERKDVDLYAVLRPAKEVGGDLYDFFIQNGRLYFIIGDVSGKGVPASLFMAITRSLFRTLSPEAVSPASIVNSMNNSITENNESNMFVTLIVGILDLGTGLLKLCNAGHNQPLAIRPDGHTSFFNLKTNLIVGMMENYPYADEEIILEKGTKLFFYTDGITEAENASKDLYGDKRLIECLSGNALSNVHTIVTTVAGSVAEHVQDADPSDDLTILIIHYEPENN